MRKRLVSAILLIVMAFSFAVPAMTYDDELGTTYHVAKNGNNTTGDGSAERPWLTVTYALTRIAGGDKILVHAGVYNERFTISNTLNGPSKEWMTRIVAAGDGEVIFDGEGMNGTTITISNAKNILIEGLTITNVRNNSYNGIRINASSTFSVGSFDITKDDPADSPFSNIIIRNNKLYNINNQEFAIACYASNYNAPVSGLVIDGNETWGNRTHYSENITLNGNIDGFTVCHNRVYDNNNIGICMIGFENTARGPTSWGADGVLGRHRYDRVRNGKVYNNVVYGSNVIDNEGYWEQDGGNLGTRVGPPEGEFDRCCNGIYVDGGKDIEIWNNLVFDCDIGIEISTEHNHPAFWVEGLYVHDNIIASCVGWNGLSMGGQSVDPNFVSTYVRGVAGQLRDSRVENNILFGNAVNMNIQHTNNITIKDNIIMGGNAAIMDWLDAATIAPEDKLWMVNNIEANVWYNANNLPNYFTDLDIIKPDQLAKQIKAAASPLADPAKGDFTVADLYSGFGTDPNDWAGTDYAGRPWKFDMENLNLYAKFFDANTELLAAIKYLEEEGPFDFEAAAAKGNLRSYLDDVLREAGFVNTTVPYILKTWSARTGTVNGAPRCDGWRSTTGTNGFGSDPLGLVNMYRPNTGNNTVRDKAGNFVNTVAVNNGAINVSTINTLAATNTTSVYKYLVALITRFDDGISFTKGETRNGVFMTVGAPAYHVAKSGNNTTGDGSAGNPWLTIAYALTQMNGGDRLLIHAGVYAERISINERLRGPSKGKMTVIKSFGDGEVVIDGGASSTTVFDLVNTGNIKVEGLTIRNGTGYGLRLNTTKTAAALAYAVSGGFERDKDNPLKSPFSNVHLINNKVYNINTGSIALMIQAENYMAPVSGLVMDGNEVFFNRTHYSESFTLNGNVDGFDVRNNIIHNNNNLGITMIGFEGLAAIPTSGTNVFAEPGAAAGPGPGQRHRYDNARNGRCYNNIVYGCSTINNASYWAEGSSQTINGISFNRQYDPSCGGIYVDGGQAIDIYNNIIWDCNLGIEVATEHNSTYYARYTKVHDNLIISNRGYVGLCFGGYDSQRGYTEYCEFTNNVIFNNTTNIEATSRSRNNIIKGNIIVGSGIIGSGRTTNTFDQNIWYNPSSPNSFPSGVTSLVAADQAKQIRASVMPLLDAANGKFDFVPAALTGTTVDLSGYTGGFGADLSGLNIGEGFYDLYKAYLAAGVEQNAARAFLHGASATNPKLFSFDEVCMKGNLREYLTEELKKAGFVNSEVPYILKTSSNTGGSGNGAYRPDGTNDITASSTGARDGIIDRYLPNSGNNIVMLKYGPQENSAAIANGNIYRDRYDSALATMAVGESRSYAYQVQIVTWYGDTSFTQDVAAIRVNLLKRKNISVDSRVVIESASVPASSDALFNPKFILRANDDITLTLYLATYDAQGKLVAVEPKTMALQAGDLAYLQNAIPYTDKTLTYKFFIWDSQFVPLTAATSINDL